MDQEQSQAGAPVEPAAERTPEAVREEIEQTRVELGDTVAELAAKTDVKAQARQAAGSAKAKVADRVAEVRETVGGGDPGTLGSTAPAPVKQRAGAVVDYGRAHPTTLAVAAGAFLVGLTVGRRRS